MTAPPIELDSPPVQPITWPLVPLTRDGYTISGSLTRQGPEGDWRVVLTCVATDHAVIESEDVGFEASENYTLVASEYPDLAAARASMQAEVNSIWGRIPTPTPTPTETT